MRDSKVRPILLFAFAAEDPTIQVEEEARAIQSALADVSRSAQLCDIEIPPFLKLQDLVDVFQKSRNRVSIFHYAGHADGAALMLRTAQGSVANAAGMAMTVQGQSGLKLVFLNGCSTENQVSHWIAAGVQCVIATTQRVNGEVARNFAARFYKGLATGASIRVAYDEAVGEATAACGGKSRLVYADDEDDASMEVETGRWPWFLQTAPGAEAVLEWNLPDAAGDPLALLPLPINGPLPDAPYPGLRRFTAADAPVFFGRGHSIRRLYERVVSPTSSPVILLHGQSGVGKSSILEAGLTPRLQISYNGSTPYDVVTIRIDPVRGLLDSLRLAYIEDACREDGTVCSGREAWCQREARLQQPVIVVLDQLEEAFTHATGAVPTDWDLFLHELCLIFNDRTKAPKGKLILSFRTEWFSRINSRLQGLWKSEVFLDCLDAAGIHEAIEGPTRRPELREYYPLTIQPGLSLRIATELLMDQVSSLAPSLQIVLQALWKDATRESRTPVFTEQLYRRHRTSLGEFVWGQMQTIANDRSVTPATRIAIKAGLLEDFLECHVTADQTARHQSLRVLVNGDSSALPPVTPRYAGREAIIRELRQLCIDHYLLIQPDGGGSAEVELSSRLAHDALAPHIRTVYEASDAIGPRARRILEQRVRERSHGVKDELDRTALSSIERGQSGMRDWTTKELLIIKAGRRGRIIRRYVVGAVVASLLFLGYLSQQYSLAKQIETAFGSDVASIESLFELCRRSPRTAVVVASRLLTEHNDGADISTSASEGELVLSDSSTVNKEIDRRAVRAAMVLIELGHGDDQCNRAIIQRLGQIDQPETAEIAELKLIIQITKRFLDSKKDHPEEVEPLRNDFLAMMNSPASANADNADNEDSEISQRNVALTVFLLSVGHEELIPANWYEPHADQHQRTQIIAQLHEWMTPEELLDVYVRHAETLSWGAARTLESSAGEPVSNHLLSMLSLAIASAPENYLSDIASLLSSAPLSPDGPVAMMNSGKELLASTELPVGSQQKPWGMLTGKQGLLRSQYLSASSTLRSSARILIRRLHEVRPNLVDSLESLDHEFREVAVLVAEDRRATNSNAANAAGKQDDGVLRPYATTRGNLLFLRPTVLADDCDWCRVEFVKPFTEKHVGLDFVRIPEDPLGGLSPFWMSVTEVPSEFYSQYFLDPDNPNFASSEIKATAPVEINEGKPQTHVSPDQAMRFCNWLSEKAEMGNHYQVATAEFLKSPTPAYPGFRLPFNDEWKHACRAGSKSPFFHFGDSDKLGSHDILGDYAWYIINSRTTSYNEVRTCATKLPNAWGLFDMVGNAGEWRAARENLRGETNTETSLAVDGNLVPGVAPLIDHSSGTRNERKVEFEIGRDSVRSFATQCYLVKPLPIADEFEPLPTAKRSIRLVIDHMPAD